MSKESVFEKTSRELNMELKRIRPYSPWQNGKVERSHREDQKILYGCTIFTSKKMLVDKVKKHEKRYNNTAKQLLGFKSPNQIVSEYFSNVLQSVTYVLTYKKKYKYFIILMLTIAYYTSIINYI